MHQTRRRHTFVLRPIFCLERHTTESLLNTQQRSIDSPPHHYTLVFVKLETCIYCILRTRKQKQCQNTKLTTNTAPHPQPHMLQAQKERIMY